MTPRFGRIMLSKPKEVSIDFLLKDEKTESSADEKGYYVSREMAVGYIANEKKTCRNYCTCHISIYPQRWIQSFEKRAVDFWLWFFKRSCKWIPVAKEKICDSGYCQYRFVYRRVAVTCVYGAWKYSVERLPCLCFFSFSSWNIWHGVFFWNDGNLRSVSA